MIIHRDIFLEIKPVINSPEAVIITGMRRVGKTTLLHYIKDSIQSQNKIYIDLENPANQKLFEETNYDKVYDNLKYFGLDVDKPGYIFLDEIQFVRNIPSLVKYLIDHYHLKFFMTGSASFYLKNLFSESLAGRKYLFELYPLNFKEFLRLKDIQIKQPSLDSEISEGVFEQMDRYYSEYLQFGGFPGVVKKQSVDEKKLALQDIFSSYFQLEVVHLGDFRKAKTVRDLILLLIERTGSKVDITKLSKELSISRPTIANYIDFLESTYFIKLIKPFSRKLDSEIRKMPKCYICDTGIVNLFSVVSKGALFENAIFSQIQNKGKINYYQTKSGAEIDFIINQNTALEIKIKPYEQDLKKLSSLSANLKLKNHFIISKRYSTMEKVKYGFML